MKRIRVSIGDKDGNLIPAGVVEVLTVDVYEGGALFHFKDQKTTRRFCTLAREVELRDFNEVRSMYVERLQKYKTRYPGLSEGEVEAKLVKEFEALGGKLI